MKRIPKTTRTTATARGSAPAIELFDYEAVANELRRLDADIGDTFDADKGDLKRKQALMNILESSAGASRGLIIGDAAMVRRMKAVESCAPNFSDPAKIIIGAITASKLSGAGLRLPPMLFVGPPGIGKTHFMHATASALATTARTIPLNLLDDSGQIVGHSSSWKAARAGAIAQTLLDGPTASPIFLCDELDKIPANSTGDPIDMLHSLLERENARLFRDQFLDFPMRADKAIWFFTANEADKIPTTIRDRLLLQTIAPLNDVQKHEFAMQRLEDALARYEGVFEAVVDDQIIDLLARVGARKLMQMIDVAIGVAAAAGRYRLRTSDFLEAQRVCGGDINAKRFGFL
jgi:ATP-dependent Lon protease